MYISFVGSEWWKFCHLAMNRYTWRHNEVLKVLTEMAKKQVEEGKYAPKPPKQGLGKTEFVPQGGKVPDRKKANKTMVKPKRCYMGGSCRLERLWEILPHPNTEKARPGDMERGRERGASGGAHSASWRQHQFGAWAERESLWGSCGRMWGGRVESNAFPSRSWLQWIHRD